VEIEFDPSVNVTVFCPTLKHDASATSALPPDPPTLNDKGSDNVPVASIFDLSAELTVHVNVEYVTRISPGFN